VRIDQPPEPADDQAGEGDPVPDEPVLENPALMAGDTEPAEPRTRHEHADPPPAADEPSDPPEESPSDELDFPDPSRLDSPGDSPANREASDNQEELPESEDPPPGPNVDANVAQPEDPLNDPPDPQPTEKPKAPQDRESSQPTQDATPSTDRPHPLTDKEWAEHLTEVRDGLDQARREGLESRLLHTIDPDRQSWSKDRRSLQDSIINDLYSSAHDIPNQGCAIVAGGLSGSGKTTVLTEQAGIDRSQYLTINPDDLKEEMARRGMIPDVKGLSPMEASDLVHAESSYLARQLALRAYADGKNLIWDITMSTKESTVRRMSELRAAGYTQVDGLFVDIPVETSIKRTDSRHREGHAQYCTGDGLGGRYVPPEVIKRQEDAKWGSQNRKTFEAVKGNFNDWSIYDNSVDERRAVLVESSTSRHAG
jgi:predicted ABC-type ATPase